ncbi:MAG: pentapeptide repeat-containing protein [Solirubrobacteraceae bacterium]
MQGSVALLALAGASVGVFVGWRQLRLTAEAQRFTAEAQKTDQRLREEQQKTDQHLREQEQITDRFLRAVNQLGSDKIDVRFGGIFALERVARDSRSDRPAINEVLSAYIRRRLPHTEARDERVDPLPYRAPDAQAALTVLCRSPLCDGRIDSGARRLDLSRTDLRRARLGEAQLQRANLWAAQLQGADLRDAHLEGAVLEHANFGRFQSDNPVFQHGADLRGANLTGAKLDNANLYLALTEGTIGLPT